MCTAQGPAVLVGAMQSVRCDTDENSLHILRKHGPAAFDQRPGLCRPQQPQACSWRQSSLESTAVPAVIKQGLYIGQEWLGCADLDHLPLYLLHFRVVHDCTQSLQRCTPFCNAVLCMTGCRRCSIVRLSSPRSSSRSAAASG